jgi:hypothetical protein
MGNHRWIQRCEGGWQLCRDHRRHCQPAAGAEPMGQEPCAALGKSTGVARSRMAIISLPPFGRRLGHEVLLLFLDESCAFFQNSFRDWTLE